MAIDDVKGREAWGKDLGGGVDGGSVVPGGTGMGGGSILNCGPDLGIRSPWTSSIYNRGPGDTFGRPYSVSSPSNQYPVGADDVEPCLVLDLTNELVLAAREAVAGIGGMGVCMGEAALLRKVRLGVGAGPSVDVLISTGTFEKLILDDEEEVPMEGRTVRVFEDVASAMGWME